MGTETPDEAQVTMAGDIVWGALASDTRETFATLSKLPAPHDFYLAGGTALALQIGHRISHDLDFFSSTNALGMEERGSLTRQLQRIESCTIRLESDGQLYATIRGVEVSFLYQRHPLLFPAIEIESILVAQPVDIGLMKLSAIKDRGTRRDFVDLYCMRHVAPFKTLFQLLPRKYSDRPDFTVHLAYALCYFDDAENDPRELRLLQKVNWAAVKKYCVEGARLLSKMNIGLEPPK
ncbi:MAG TPA: nucleotidyl transferase AbiEii/AbiGii toxin family protein [Anaerolineae bacterium]